MGLNSSRFRMTNYPTLKNKLMKNILSRLMNKGYWLNLMLCAVLCAGCKPSVKEGQIWVKEYNLDNPFEEIQRDTLIIIRVSGDYVKYKRRGKIMSDDKFWIPVNARRIK